MVNLNNSSKTIPFGIIFFGILNSFLVLILFFTILLLNYDGGGCWHYGILKGFCTDTFRIIFSILAISLVVSSIYLLKGKNWARIYEIILISISTLLLISLLIWIFLIADFEKPLVIPIIFIISIITLFLLYLLYYLSFSNKVKEFFNQLTLE